MTFLEYQKYALGVADKMKQESDKVAFVSLFRSYVLAKLMLDQSVCEDDFLELAQLSIKSLSSKNDSRNTVEAVTKYDCHNISSPIKKKVLFLSVVEKTFSVKFENDRLFLIDTIEQLGEYLFCLMRKV